MKCLYLLRAGRPAHKDVAVNAGEKKEVTFIFRYQSFSPAAAEIIAEFTRQTILLLCCPNYPMSISAKRYFSKVPTALIAPPSPCALKLNRSSPHKDNKRKRLSAGSSSGLKISRPPKTHIFYFFFIPTYAARAWPESLFFLSLR